MGSNLFGNFRIHAFVFAVSFLWSTFILTGGVAFQQSLGIAGSTKLGNLLQVL